MTLHRDTEGFINDLLRLAPVVEITRHTRGRVRLKMFLRGVKVARQTDLARLADHCPGILGVEVRRLFRSVIIDYDPQRIPFSLWENLNRLKSRPGLAEAVRVELRELLCPVAE